MAILRTGGHTIKKCFWTGLFIDGRQVNKEPILSIIESYIKFLKTGHPWLSYGSFDNTYSWSVYFTPKCIKIGCKTFSHADIMEIILFLK